ncbi:MAG: hypothetical protein ACRDNS_33095 [Trebonia sp.]
MASLVAGTVIRFQNYTGPIATPTGGFRDISGALIDPSTVELIYQTPDLATHTLVYPTGVTKDAVGLYGAGVDSTGMPGIWTFAWKSTGTGQAYANAQIFVNPAPL